MYISLLKIQRDPMISEVLISSNNMLSKAEKEKELQIYISTSNTIIHKKEYATMYWSCSFSRIKY